MAEAVDNIPAAIAAPASRSGAPRQSPISKATVALLFLTVLVIATTGLVYELLASTVSSYLLGDSVKQFSLVIGVYLSALGLGAWLSRFVVRGVSARFIEIELATALIGGLSAPILFWGFAHATWFGPLLYGVVICIGTLVGLELPLLMRILKDELDFNELVARVLSVDYAGALIGSVCFAIFFVPTLGLVRTSLVMGILNAVVALLSTYVLAPALSKGRARMLRGASVLIAALLLTGFAYANRLTYWAEEGMYTDRIVHTVQTPYQRIVVTQGRGVMNLHLNGNLQFSSSDEYRYHEALVHPALAATTHAKNALVLGGGDGLAVRELLKYPGIEHITLVDLDDAVTHLARTLPSLVSLNQSSLDDPRVRVVNDDAMVWADNYGASLLADGADAPKQHPRFDVIIIDFPDPNNFAVGKLYTTRFYRIVERVLAPDGVIAVQSTSPLVARRSFWCVVRTLETVGFSTQPYHALVPAFGEWGFVLAKRAADTPNGFAPPAALSDALAATGSRVALKYLNDAVLASLFVFGPDMLSPGDVEPNRLNDQQLVRYYDEEWSKLGAP